MAKLITSNILPSEGEINALSLPDNSIALKPFRKKQDSRYLNAFASQDKRGRWLEEIKSFSMIIECQEINKIIWGQVTWVLNRLIKEPEN